MNSEGFIRRNGWIGLVLVLACAGAGSGLLQLARNAVSEAEVVAGWTQTEGLLRELVIAPQPGLTRTRYAVSAHYTFWAGGREQSGSLIFGPTSAADPLLLKRQLAGWMTESLARIDESGSGLGYRFRYAPFGQAIPVYYDPARPATARAGTPGRTSPVYGNTLRWAGWMVIGLSALVGLIALNQWRSWLAQAVGRRRAAAGLPRPSPADESAWIQRVDQAIAAFDAANGLATTGAGCLDSLRVLRTIPAEALLHHERLGLSRSLSEQGFAEDGDPAANRILEAVSQVESFHREWRNRVAS